MHKHALVLLMALVVALPVLAQEQRASIEGTVTDSSGAVLPGVTVEARSAGGAVVSTVTDGSGVYRFPALRPGTYEVTASLAGFTTQKAPTINVSLGQILRADLSLAPQGVAEELEVTGESPLIDVKQSARQANIRDEYIEKLPKGRDFTTLVTQAPGANNESKLGGLSIDGASAGENRYVIDGTETTNVQMGNSGKNLIVDFVDEVQVKSSGYTAEYGGTTGGVVNVITKSGSNSFAGDAGFYYTGSALMSDGYYTDNTAASTAPTGTIPTVRPETLRLVPTNTSQAEYVRYAPDDSSRWEPGFSLGGPIVKDRLWYFGGYQPNLLSIDRAVTLTVDGSQVSRTRDITDHNATANVTAQVANNLRLRGAFNSSSSIREGLLPAINGTDPVGTLYDITSKFPNYSYSGSADYVVSPKLFLSARAGYFFQDRTDENIPQGPLYRFGSTTNIGMAGVPGDLQRQAGFQSLPTNSETQRDNLNRLDLQADATWYAAFAGQHAFKGGVQVNRIGNDVFFGETGNRVDLRWDQAFRGQRGQFGYYLVRSNGLQPQLGFLRAGEVHSNTVGLFIQDAWTINNRLTLNLGLRTEKEDLPSFNEHPGISFSYGEKLAPRAGLAWNLRGDGRTKVYGSWGIFYDIMKYELPRGSFGGEHWLDYWYTLDTPNWPTLVGSGCGADCPGTLILGPVDRRHPSNDPADHTVDADIKPMKMQEAVAGFEHELFARVSGTVRYVHKQIDVAIEDIGTLDAQQNEIYTIGNPGIGQGQYFFVAGTNIRKELPKAVRDYDSVEFAVNRRFADNWGVRVSYLWSRLNGNYSGLSQSDENGRLSPNVGRLFDYPVMSFGENGQPVLGVLATDRTHQFKTQFIYQFPFGTGVGVNQYVASGIPITREAAFIGGNAFPVPYLGRNSDGRTPVFSQTNLLLTHELRLGRGNRLQLTMDVQNLFDQDAASNRFPTELAAGQAIDVSEEEFYNGVNTQQLIQDQHLVRDARFLMNSAFQEPRSIRFGVKFLF
jgi:hypothetical protein